MADKEHAKGLAWLHHKAAKVAEQKRSNPAPTETISLISQFLIGNTVERQSSTETDVAMQVSELERVLPLPAQS